MRPGDQDIRQPAVVDHRVRRDPGASGRRDELKLTVALPFERLGLANTQLRANATYRVSKVLDPVTGRQRQIQGLQNTIYEAYITRDVPKWRSTFSIGGRFGFHLENYRLVETRGEKRPIALDATWIWKVTDDWQLRVQLDNLAPKLITRDRDTCGGCSPPRSIRCGCARPSE